MNEHRSSTSEGIWIGLCVLLLFVTAGAGAFGLMEFRRAAALEEKVLVITRENEAERYSRLVATEQSADIAPQVHELEKRVGELEAENQKLREQLNGAGE